MVYISSDTNVWIDYNTISRLRLPFLLPYTYVMYTESMDDELLSPENMKRDLIDAGLVGIDITFEEFAKAENWGSTYPKLSVPDRIALAIASTRKIPLLTGDGNLRKAANREGVEVWGTIRVLDELYSGRYIDEAEYRYCLESFLRHAGGVIRLPVDALKSRLEQLA